MIQYFDIMMKADEATRKKVAYYNDGLGRHGIFAKEALTDEQKAALNLKFVGRQPRFQGGVSLYRYIYDGRMDQ